MFKYTFEVVSNETVSASTEEEAREILLSLGICAGHFVRATPIEPPAPKTFDPGVEEIHQIDKYDIVEAEFRATKSPIHAILAHRREFGSGLADAKREVEKCAVRRGFGYFDATTGYVYFNARPGAITRL